MSNLAQALKSKEAKSPAAAAAPASPAAATTAAAASSSASASPNKDSKKEGIEASAKDDHLSLASNAKIKQLFKAEGEEKEIVFFSEKLFKFNSRGLKQNRVILITDKAVYNLKPPEYAKSQRRIPLEKLSAITTNQNGEFVLHVANEHDYHFHSKIADKICGMIAALRKNKTGKPLPVKVTTADNLKSVAVTKAKASRKPREEQHMSRMSVGCKDKNSDDDDDDKDIKSLLEQKEKVTVHDFEMIIVLGRGGYGKVMKVRKKDTGKMYAMKVLKKSHIVAKGQIEHTKVERKILEAQQHPFLMNLRYAFQSKDKLYFVTDLLEGGELFVHLNYQQFFSEADTRIYIAEVVLALEHLHKQKIIYRDLKPENLLLDDTGHIRLTDYGLSKFVSNNEKATSIVGTFEYMAPEVLTGKGHTFSADWWSLGVLIYELTNGSPPFNADDRNEIPQLVLKAQYKIPKHLADTTKSLIQALLVVDPEKRLGSKRDGEEIREHAYFKGLNWQDVLAKKYTPSFKPSKNEQDNFNPKALELTFNSVVKTDADGSMKPINFSQFTYTEGKN